MNLHVIPIGIPRTKLYGKFKWVASTSNQYQLMSWSEFSEPQPVPLLGKRKRDKKGLVPTIMLAQIVTELRELIHIYQAVHVRQIPRHGAVSAHPVRTHTSKFLPWRYGVISRPSPTPQQDNPRQPPIRETLPWNVFLETWHGGQLLCLQAHIHSPEMWIARSETFSEATHTTLPMNLGRSTNLVLLPSGNCDDPCNAQSSD
ncbi:F-box domain-containing protein [Psidium guajava]|nr:F-box domain-containing protein [Psidium guajava]